MKLRFPTATIAAVTFFASLAAGMTSPVLAEETASPTIVTNLRATPMVPANAPVRFAPPAEVVQTLSVVPAELTAADDSVTDSTTDFSTLDAAVAAQSAAIDDEELNCLAVSIYFESKGEPLAGQLAVADVILNRTTSGRFPSSVCSVVKQPGQFSFVKGGRLPDIDTSRRAWKTAVAVARVATKDLWQSPAKNALYFHARHVSPNWGKARVASVGNHIFYR
ncbi:cell wall hydrolase [Sphingomonas sp. Leaf407]|uniref:cell wall hydrolase n=1 Tax=Sphingomonas sp. Leaf407 TaxID=1736369 RepID=UPI0009E8E3DB|nr:cell wall hydrolase [Sphingomonas sp. Leaf407]